MATHGFLRQVFEQILGDRSAVNSARPLASPDDIQRAILLSLGDEVTPDKELLEICDVTLANCSKPGGAALAGVPSRPDAHALAGSWTAQALNTNQHTFEVAPVFVVMEQEVVRQVAALIGYQEFDGHFCAGHSISYLYALSIARYKLFPHMTEDGISAIPKLAVFSTENLDSSLQTSMSFMGLGSNSLYSVSRDHCARMEPQDLACNITTAIAEGRLPFLVCASAGSSVTGAVDPLPEIADLCARHQIWLHVDASLGGALLFSGTHKNLLSHLHRADSVSWGADTLLGAARDCTIFMTRHLGLLRACHESKARYLFPLDRMYDVSYDVGEKSIQCGRTTDVFKIWLLWKAKGTKGLGDHVDGVMAMACYFVGKIQTSEGFRLVFHEPQCPVICFWYIPFSMREKETDPTWSENVSKVTTAIHRQITRDGHVSVGIEGAMGMPCYLKVTLSSDVTSQVQLDHVLQICADIGEKAE